MKRITGLSVLLGIAAAAAITAASGAGGNGQLPVLEGRLIAVGIPGVSAVAPVGTFLPGGPIPTKFAAYTQPGQVLDPKRILVGSTSNFGEPLWDPNQLPGSFLSIDPTGDSVLVIPPAFASGAGRPPRWAGWCKCTVRRIGRF